ncbi:MAG: ribosome small subunit-dependent GTPase A [Anaerolineales bacterium]|nr:ribosome small subunit-dependent GTPase A [Anaerolineales bacterium]
MADKSHDKHLQRSIKMGFEKERERRQIQKVKKQLKHNRQLKPSRRKDWQPGDIADPDELDFEQAERVMPRGERERRRNIKGMALTEVAEEPNEANSPLPLQTGQQGVVIEVSSGLCRVALGERTLMCGLRGSLSAEETGFTNVVAVGDNVLIFEDGTGRGIVEAVLPRHSALARPDVFRSHLQQVIVANANQLLVVASWRNPSLWPELLDRYLIAAARNKLKPIICVNKIDLAEDVAACEAALQPYRALGYPVLLTSALTGYGIEVLRDSLRGRITALAGMSGVGKSSLLAAAQPGLQLRTSAVSELSGEGRHTTTQVTMLPFGESGFVVDTPGIREFGLSGLAKSELIQFYPDLAAFAPGCRFADCTHRHEPSCAVKAAVAAGSVSATRYDSYQKIYGTLT